MLLRGEIYEKNIRLTFSKWILHDLNCFGCYEKVEKLLLL